MQSPADQSFLFLSRAQFYFTGLPSFADEAAILSPRPASMLRRCLSFFLCVVVAIAAFVSVTAQTADGNNGLSQANTMVRSYFDVGTQLLYAVGALAGLIGAFKVYRSLDAQDGRVKDHIAIWLGACIFLVMAATVLKSFFGV